MAILSLPQEAPCEFALFKPPHDAKLHSSDVMQAALAWFSPRSPVESLGSSGPPFADASGHCVCSVQDIAIGDITVKPASILITDDESNIRLMVRTALQSDGYLVREASNGNEALRAIELQSPDLLVLDMNMPGMDGMAVLERLKKLAVVNRPRVMVLTAYASIATAVRATQLGAADFLEKPITPTELRQAVRTILAKPGIG